ncbi:MAG: nuclear transport factor 2 family protein [Thermoplasmata archaeon]|nr:nuclear transport factor 2 family protein [Thermoplasmata archaeon]
MAPGRRLPDSEIRAIRKIVLDYILSWYTMDRTRLKNALHPKLAKRMVWPDDRTGRSTLLEYPTPTMLRSVVKGRLLSAAERKKGGATWTGRIRILDRFQDMCVVRTEARWGIDYIHLAKWNGEWKIINVLWKYVPTPDD